MAPPTLADLPPELLDHITAYLPTAQSLDRLGRTSRALHRFVEKEGWQSFTRTRFPSLHPQAPHAHKDAARTLASLSKAWDRRAFVARYTEPHGDIRAYPGASKVERWKRAKGQTIGFTPQLDVYEEVGQCWRERKEVLAFSAGAEVCVRQKARHNYEHEDVRWMTYRPLSACEGRDDVTTLHLLKPQAGEGSEAQGRQRLISGTANGDLWILSLTEGERGDVPITYFTTQGLPVRSSSVLERPFQQTLLAANMSDSRVSVYPVDPSQPKVAPLSSIDIRPPQAANGQRAKHQRVWSTQFLSPSHIAAGIGPSDEPIHVYHLTPSGVDKEPIRKFSLQNHLSQPAGEKTLSGVANKSSSSIYPIVPLPPFNTGAGSSDGDVFLSGAYDGIIRLHDLRSNREVEQAYSDPTDDSSIYSLLPRGQETLVAGTSRHSLLKVFDMRLGAQCYSYLNATSGLKQAVGTERQQSRDWNLFLKPSNASYSGRGGGNNWSRRSHQSSIYSLASSSPHSPYLYAGLQNAVVELSFTSVLDAHPDPTFFAPWRPAGKGRDDNWHSKQVLDLAMYEQNGDLKLCSQRSVWETCRLKGQVEEGSEEQLEGLDERWRVGTGPS